jgi:hypothetical protein
VSARVRILEKRYACLEELLHIFSQVAFPLPGFAMPILEDISGSIIELPVYFF